MTNVCGNPSCDRLCSVCREYDEEQQEQARAASTLCEGRGDVYDCHFTCQERACHFHPKHLQVIARHNVSV